MSIDALPLDDADDDDEIAQELLSQFTQYRKQFIEAGIQKGRHRMSYVATEKKHVLTKSLKNKTGRKMSLIEPRKKAWPIKSYIKKFGDPKLPQNKAKGHKKTNIDGKEFVIVSKSSDSEDEPWDLEVSHNNENYLEQDLDVVENDDEDFENQLEDKFADITAQDDEDLARASSGMSFKALMEELAAAEQSDEDKGDDAGAREARLDAAVQHADGSGIVADSDDEDMPLRPARKRVLKMAPSDASAGGGASAKAKTSGGASAKAKAAKGKPKKDAVTPKAPQRGSKPEVKVEQQHCASPAPSASGSAGPAAAIKRGEQPKQVASESREDGKKGKPATDLVRYSQQLAAEFGNAGADSVFFHPDRSGAQLRSIIRCGGI